MKTLIIVESPKKAKQIQDYLGAEYKVMSSKGHIADLAKTGAFHLGVNIDDKFKPKYVLLDDKVDLLDQLIQAAQNADIIYLLTDRDREGEAIAWHLHKRLFDCGKPLKRIEVGEITKKAVLEALKNPRDVNLNTFHSQEARRILDRIVGFMSSPFLMNSFGPKLSAGRVQSVVTRMVIDRENEIEKFIPEEYWVIKANLSKDNKESFWTKYDLKVSDKNTAEIVKSNLQGNNLDSKFIVNLVISDEEKRKAPPPMVTSELQRVMSKSFGFSADRTMKAAQNLYETGYVTYIRTDSVRAEPDATKNLRKWLSNKRYSIPKIANAFKNKNAAQDAHECIRPTDLSVSWDGPEFVNGDEKKVYEIVWKYFVASQMNPAIYDTLKVSIYLEKDKKCILKTSGKALKDKGFLEILGVNDSSKIDIPFLNKGDELFLKGKEPISCEKKFTQPPPRYSEDTLIKALVVNGIGRPATFAEILSKITSRNYVEKKGSVYHATSLGKSITECLIKYFTFMDYDYTSELEKKLDMIEEGKINHTDMLYQFYEPFKKELEGAYLAYGASLCEKCNSPMAVKQSKAGDKFLGCSKYPICFNTKPFFQEKIEVQSNISA